MITAELNRLATVLRQAIVDQDEEHEGELSDYMTGRLLNIVEPQDNEVLDDYRRRLVEEIDACVIEIAPCDTYLYLLNEEVKPVDHLLARKLYQRYRDRWLDRHLGTNSNLTPEHRRYYDDWIKNWNRSFLGGE
jgi:hypothetical protein